MSKPARKRPESTASGELALESATSLESVLPPREPIQTVGYAGGCYIHDGAAVDANGNPIIGLVVIDGLVYRESPSP
jgi:hypothetical protein